MEHNILQEFLAASTLKSSQDTAYLRGEKPPLPEKPFSLDAERVALPEPELLPDKQVNFLELVELRSTVRTYSKAALTMKELSYLLWCTQGVKMQLENGTTMRTVPSAGARHALETYLLLQRVEGLSPGLYRFLALEHALLPVDCGAGVLEKFLPGFKSKKLIEGSAATFIWVAELERMAYRFGARAYRYLFLDAGHVCENLYLAAQTMGIGVCAIGAFYDEELNRALGLDGTEEFAIYAATAGKP